MKDLIGQLIIGGGVLVFVILSLSDRIGVRR
jgi:hypothetical protein